MRSRPHGHGDLATTRVDVAGAVPRDHWIEPEVKAAIVDFHAKNPLEGYRRLTFMMLDQDVAAVSPSTAHRVLSAAGRLDRWKRGPSKKGTGFVQPLAPHEHWHVERCRHVLLPLLAARRHGIDGDPELTRT